MRRRVNGAFDERASTVVNLFDLRGHTPEQRHAAAAKLAQTAIDHGAEGDLGAVLDMLGLRAPAGEETRSA